jgi:hypothetical protein
MLHEQPQQRIGRSIGIDIHIKARTVINFHQAAVVLKLQYNAPQTARFYDDGFVINKLVPIAGAVKKAAKVLYKAIYGQRQQHVTRL